jgi:galactokinase/galacturonokinase
MIGLRDLLLRERQRLCDERGLEESDVRGVVSPYRICPIGAHIDHQLGPVLGIAIDAGSALVFAPSDDAFFTVRSADFPGEVRFALPAPGAEGPDRWGTYARAAASVLAHELPEKPIGGVARIAGGLPGAGLGSSASVILAYLGAIAMLNGIRLDARQLVQKARRAENEFVGLACGILDPASIVGARRNHLLVIDTRAETWESASLGGEEHPRVLLAFSGISRNLPGTGFNTRVGECGEAARLLARRAGLPPARRLGDLGAAVVATHLDALTPRLARRARHFAEECARVRAGVERWRDGDLGGFGRLMNESCRSSIENYETGSTELVALHSILRDAPGVFGGRFSGAGFGGCAVALVDARRADACRDHVERAYLRLHPQLEGRARVFLADSDDGLRLNAAAVSGA